MPAPQVTHERQRVPVRKRQVEHENVGLAGRDEVAGVGFGRRLTDDLESVVTSEHEAQTLAHEMMVVDQTHPDRRRH